MTLLVMSQGKNCVRIITHCLHVVVVDKLLRCILESQESKGAFI